jgi:hypothetical protein
MVAPLTQLSTLVLDHRMGLKRAGVRDDDRDARALARGRELLSGVLLASKETTMPVLWAGKVLDADEELRLRRVVALLRRIEESGQTDAGQANAREDRMILERFLPENVHRWTPDELEFGAHNGPGFLIDDVAAGQP